MQQYDEESVSEIPTKKTFLDESTRRDDFQCNTNGNDINVNVNLDVDAPVNFDNGISSIIYGSEDEEVHEEVIFLLLKKA